MKTNLMMSMLLANLLVATVTSAGVEVSFTYHGPRTVHVVKSPDGAKARRSFAVKNLPAETSAAASEIVVERTGDTLTFKTRDGRTLLAEKSPAEFARHAPVKVPYTRARQAFARPVDELLFGLGDLENGRILANGVDEWLRPANVGDGIPYVVSANGWALFWDNDSATRFTDVPGEELPSIPKSPKRSTTGSSTAGTRTAASPRCAS